MKKLLLLCALTCSIAPLSALKVCIVGGSRGIGYNLALKVLESEENTCTLVARKPEELETLYKDLSHKPVIVQGKATEEIDSLVRAAQGADYIVMAQTFPYKIWDKSIRKMTTHCIDAAIKTNATLIYYGRVYAKGILKDDAGNILPITEESVPDFSTIPKGQGEQSKTLHDIETQITDSECKSIIIRHGYPYGPNSGDGLIHDSFKKLAQNSANAWFSSGRFRWIGSDEVSMPVTFLPDLAAFTLQYIALPSVQSASHSVINFAGDNVDGIREIGEAFMNECGFEYDAEILSKSKLSLGASFNKEAKRAKDVFYGFVNELLLDESKRKSLLSFTATPRAQAIKQTFDWYAKKA